MFKSYIEWKKKVKCFHIENSHLSLDVNLYDYFLWRKNRFKKNKYLENPYPWLTNKTINFLKSYKGDDINLFEWGSGASTLWYSKQGYNVYTVEHDKEWYESLISHQIYKENKNIEITYISLQISKNRDKDCILSSRMPGYDFTDYVNAINKYNYEFFDLIVVDGRSRVHCLNVALRHLKRGGWIILDNADRKDYMTSNELNKYLLEWQSLDLSGVVYGIRYISGAKAWRKPN